MCVESKTVVSATGVKGVLQLQKTGVDTTSTQQGLRIKGERGVEREEEERAERGRR